MTNDRSIDRELFRLTQGTRVLGLEAGLSLLLILVHVRYRSMLTGAGEPWRRLLESAPGEFPGLLADVLDDEDWRYSPASAVARGPHAELLPTVHELENLLAGLTVAREDVRAAHHEVFEALLEQTLRSQGRTWEASTTRPDVARLMVALCGRPLGDVIDPAAGLGAALLAARARGADRLTAWDVNGDVLDLLRLRAHLADATVRIERRSALADTGDRGRFDTVLLAPPWGLRPSPSLELADEWRYWGKGSLDLVWVALAERLTGGGQAVVHLPLGQLARESAAPQRAELMPSISAVVALPAGAGAGTGIRSALLVLDRDSRDELLMLSLEGATEGGRGGGALDPAAVDDVVDRLRAWRSGVDPADVDAAGIAKVVHADALAEDLSFAPARYVGQGAEVRSVRPEPAGRLLRQVSLENVKSFGDEATAELAPITLIYGPNASGKSTLLQALMLAKQSLEEGAPLLNGSHARLGGFPALVHRHNSERQARIRLEFDVPQRWELGSEIFSPDLTRRLELRLASGLGGVVELSGVIIGAGDVEFTFAKDDEGVWQLPSDQAVALVEAITEPRRMWHAKPAAKTLSPSRCSDVRGVLRKADMVAVPFASAGLLPDRLDVDLTPWSDGRTPDRSQLAETSLRRAANVLDAARAELERVLREMGYLGPIRSAPKRTYERGALNRHRTLDPEGATAANFLFDNPSEAKLARRWLADLKIPYGIEVHALESAHPGVGDVLHLELTDQRFTPPVLVSPADVGFGVSQVLPLVVQLLAARDQVICIEQPEIHLHPRLQAEFAELLIETTSAEGQANQVLVETHSEHLMLRIQRRIRDGSLDSDDVAVLYVDLQEDEQQATIRRLRLDPRGRFLDRWPGGFFDERFAEVFDTDSLPRMPTPPVDEDEENDDE